MRLLRINTKASCQGAKSRTAFTMVEIAICLAVIGFALVAIVGVLPLGMQVQQDNREETIINNDGAFFLEAIRHGRPIDDLTVFVEEITLWSNRPSPIPLEFYYQVQITNNPTMYGSNVVGLLSNPTSLRNEAIVRSMNGPAADTGSFPQDLAFRYKLFTEIRPLNAYDPGFAVTNLFSILQSNHLHEVRLTFRYPLLPGNRTGTGKKVFRAVVSGQMQQITNGVNTTVLPWDDELWFFRPQQFTAGLP